ncbi:MAG: type II toxin-antitoxin system HicB family antitoxin [Chloroflexota bacterium]|nr:type II toxin-antitoxin system HicB family antitoxin [Anaerolineae bacterium]
MQYIIVTFEVTREGDHYISRCQELGTASFGRSEEEAVANVKEATLVYLNTLEDLGEREQVLKDRGIAVHRANESADQKVTCPPNAIIHSAVFPVPAWA